MSKAFTRESDDAPERPMARRVASALPPGVTNYMTSSGVRALQVELEGLQAGPDSPAVRQRVVEIQQVLESVVAAPPPPPPWEKVLFGATVTVRELNGEETVYRIVGVDELDLDRNWISWLSPLAKALLKARVGDKIQFRAPGGEQTLEIAAVRFD